MILKKYGQSYQSVELDFDARAMTEVGFRRDRKFSIPTDEFSDRYAVTRTLELSAAAHGAVQDEAEQALLKELESKVRDAEAGLEDSEVLVIESTQGVDYPKTRDQKTNEFEGGDTVLHFHWTIDPPLRLGVYRANR